MMNQYTILYYQTCPLIGSVVDQWYLVCTSWPFLFSCSISITLVYHKGIDNCMYGCNFFDIYSRCSARWRKRSMLDLDILVTFSVVLKRWYLGSVAIYPFISSGIFSMHLSNLIDNEEFNFTWKGVFDGHPKVFVKLALCNDYLFNIFALCVNVSENTIDNIRINIPYFRFVEIPEYSTLLSFDPIICHIPVIFVSIIDHYI